jgi:hypothetical protein
VLITVEDTENRAHVKMERAIEEVKKLLVPSVGTRALTFGTHALNWLLILYFLFFLEL